MVNETNRIKELEKKTFFPAAFDTRKNEKGDMQYDYSFNSDQGS
jgi:hypothetical protein